jgi:hypothetical protein
MKTVYSFSGVNGAYVQPVELDDSDLSPLENGVYLIPADCTEVPPPSVSEAEYAAWDGLQWVILAKPEEPVEPVEPPPQDPKDAIRAQIKALEAEQLMPRATREFMLTFMEMNALAEVLAVNHGYQAVKAFDNQINALRDQL